MVSFGASDCRHGVYIVSWFRDRERYNHPTSWADARQLATELAERTKTVARANDIALNSYVIDLTTPHRKH